MKTNIISTNRTLSTLKLILLPIIFVFIGNVANAADRFAVASGNWNSTATWSATSGGAAGASVPLAADVVYIENGRVVTVTANAACASIVFQGTNIANALVINATFTLTLTGSVTLNSAAAANTACAISGGGTLSCASVNVGGIDPAPGAAYTVIMTSTLANFNISGNLALNGWEGTRAARLTSPQFQLESGILDVNGQITATNETANVTSVFSMATGAQTGTLLIAAATQFANPALGTFTRTLNGTAATVNYDLAGVQTVYSTTYTNLTLSGSGNKTMAAFTVNGKLSRQGTAVPVTTAPVYGPASTLEYKGSALQTATAIEFPATNGPGNLIIDNALNVTFPASFPRTITGAVTLTNGILTTVTGSELTVNNTSTSAITGASATRYISGPLVWQLATGSTYAFPVGKGGTYYPFGLTSITGTAPAIRVEAFNASTGGTAGAPLTTLSTTEYWSASISSGTFSGGSVSLTRQIAIGTMTAIGRSATLTGAYSNLNGTISGTSIINSNNTGATLDFFVMAAGCTAPTITLGANPSVCGGTTSANLTYSATTDSPNQYSIVYDATALGQGFVNVTNAALPASPIILTVPAAAAAATYNYTLTLRNSTTGCVSGSYAKTVIVNPPTPATPGIISGSDNALPSTAGYIYSISSVTNATTYNWTVPTGWTVTAGSGTTSITVTSGTNGQNGNITVTAGNSCGTSAASTKAVTSSPVSSPPTITLGTRPTICRGTTTANLPYSATTDSPNQYSIVYDATALGQGFVNVTNAALPATPIILTVPAAAAASVYNAILTVRNSSTGLSSVNYVITVTVNAAPLLPLITGSTPVPANSTGFIYSVTPVSGATGYTWTVPAGWTITAGTNTHQITVTTGASGQNGNITCSITNACGTSPVRSLAVTVSLVTNHALYNCSSCHILHNAPGSGLTNVGGNALLCQSCHISGGAGGLKPMANGVNGITSHGWDKLAVNAIKETNTPTNTQMALRIVAGRIICSTCHDQHKTSAGTPHLRISNAGDVMCKDCHSARNVGNYSTAPATNKGSHPVGVTYSGTGSVKATPTGGLLAVGGRVECSSCHKTHNAATSDGTMLRAINNAALCNSCHTYASHNGMDCLKCHQTHNTNKSNIMMIRNTIATPNSGNMAVVFTAKTGAGSFSNGSTPYNGVCQACHTATTHHRNNVTSTHNTGTNCTSCHSHSNNFTPSGGNCTDCHNAIAGYTTGAHAKHTVGLYAFACSTCHFNQGSGGSGEPTHPSGGAGEVAFNPTGLAKRNGSDAAVPAWTLATKTCSNIYCHSNGRTAYRGTDGTNTWGGGSVGPKPVIYATAPNWATGKITTCVACHPGIGNMVAPYDITPTSGQITAATDYPISIGHGSNTSQHSGNGTLSLWGAQVQCFFCHETDTRQTSSAGTTKKQGTYGTGFHVDGQTHFKIATFPAGSGGIGVDRMTVGGHCAGKSCWTGA